MNDEQRLEDERIAKAAREVYNLPPQTPREEMWTAIERRLEIAAAGSDGKDVADRKQDGVIRLNAPERARVFGRLSWWIGLAAALVIGLALGRLSFSTGPDGSRVAAGPQDAETTVVAVPDTPEDAGPDGAATDAPASVADPPESDPPPEATRAAPPDVFDRGASRAPYVAATREHLNRSESFLAGVRLDLAAGSADDDFEAWARSLLSRTRLLLASPAGQDPDTRRLLEDLELMLAQVVVSAATNDPAEARLLGEGLESGDLLRRLRSAAGAQIGPGDIRTSRTSSL